MTEIMPQLIPAILTKDPSEVEEKIRFLEGIPEITDVQIDFADGKFVPNETAMPKELFGLETRLYLEAHLMTRHPQYYFHDLENLGARTIFLHHESQHSVHELLTAVKNVKALGPRVGLAISPHTEASAFDPFINEIDVAMILGVNPGWQGQKFLPETLERVADLRKRHSGVIIEVDGGVSLENIESIAAHGADRIVVGSAIWQTADPKKTIQKFLKKIR